jgi:DNA-directed RNA polymerase beta subunit
VGPSGRPSHGAARRRRRVQGVQEHGIDHRRNPRSNRQHDRLELPDLIAIQRESFEWFLKEGLAETFRDISPIKDFTETLQLELEFDPDDEDLRPPPKFSVEECKEKDMTYARRSSCAPGS